MTDPSLGDLCLDSDSEDQAKSGTVFIYYTDEFHAQSWGTICDDGVNTYSKNVMCRQLGYESADFQAKSRQVRHCETRPVARLTERG